MAILLFVTLHKGDAVASQAMCQSLINRKLNPEICLGAISSLAEDGRKASSRVLELISYKSLFTPVLFGVAILPLFFTTWWQKETYVLLVISAVSLLPLFIVAIDWGRWVYILTFMLFCLALAERVTVKLPFKSIFVIAGVIYLTTWSIPHCCVGGVGKGFFESVGYYRYRIIEKLKQY